MSACAIQSGTPGAQHNAKLLAWDNHFSAPAATEAPLGPLRAFVHPELSPHNCNLHNFAAFPNGSPAYEANPFAYLTPFCHSAWEAYDAVARKVRTHQRSQNTSQRGRP